MSDLTREQQTCEFCAVHPAIGWQVNAMGLWIRVCAECAAPGQPITERYPLGQP